MPNITALHFEDHSESEGFFGTVVAKSDVTGMTYEEREAEKRAMLSILGDPSGSFYSVVEVETIPAMGCDECDDCGLVSVYA